MLRSAFASIFLSGLVFAALCCMAARLFWVFDLFTHGTPYWFLAAILSVLSLVLLKAWKRTLLAALVAAYFALGLAPYFFASSSPKSSAHQLRVLHFNLLNGNREHVAIETFLRAQEADVVILQEFDPRHSTALRTFTESFPYREIDARRGVFGMALLSRYPISDLHWHRGQETGIPFLSATLDVDGAPLRLVAAHPPPPVRQRSARQRNAIMVRVGELAAGDGPRLVIGDLNCTPWSPHFRALCRGAGLRDSARGRGLKATWYRSFLPIGIPIDHVLVSPEIGIEARAVGPDLGSDHRPLTVDLSF